MIKYMNFNNVEIINRLDFCSGCSSCMGICPEDCINIVRFKNGTYHPQIDHSKCTNCNLCVKVCPMVNEMEDISQYLFKDRGEYNLLIGDYINLYKGYSMDSNIRFNATSGGLVTTLLIYLLETGLIDGALVTKMNSNNYLETEPFIASTREEIVLAIGSKYIPVPLNKILKTIKNAKGKFAIVGLPCHIKGIRKLEKYDKDYIEKIRYHFGLFCSHYIDYNGIKFLLHKMGLKEKEIEYIKFRGEGWPSGLRVYLKNGNIKQMKMLGSWWSEILGSYYFCPYSCIFCDDSTCEYADLSFGDSYLKENKNDSIGTSVVISRTNTGEELLRNAIKSGQISLFEISKYKMIESQKFPIFFKKRNIISRLNLSSKMKKYFPEMIIKYEEKYLTPKRYDYLAAKFVFKNIYTSNSRILKFFLNNLSLKFLMGARKDFKENVLYNSEEDIKNPEKIKKLKVFVTNSHSNNRGDEAAQRCMVEGIKKFFPQSEITISTDNPAGLDIEENVKKIEFLNFYKRKFIYKKFFASMLWLLFKNIGFNLKKIEKKYYLFNYLSIIKESDIVISAPGGPYIGDLYKSHEISHLLQIYYAKKMGKKVMIYAPSMGPFQNKIYNFIRKKILNNVDIITVRDSESYQHLIELNLSKPLIYLTADSVFDNQIDFKNKYYSDLITTFKIENNIDEKDVLIGFTPAGYQWNIIGSDNNWNQKKYNEIISEFLNNIVRIYNVKIIFFPQLYGKDSDLSLINNIVDLIEERKNIIIFNKNLDYCKQQAVISVLDFYISNRYHPVVFSLLAGIPPISISYQFKSINLMKRAGLEELVIDISKLSTAILLEKFKFLHDNYEKIIEDTKRNIEHLKYIAALNPILFKLLVQNNNLEIIKEEVKKILDRWK